MVPRASGLLGIEGAAARGAEGVAEGAEDVAFGLFAVIAFVVGAPAVGVAVEAVV